MSPHDTSHYGYKDDIPIKKLLQKETSAVSQGRTCFYFGSIIEISCKSPSKKFKKKQEGKY